MGSATRTTKERMIDSAVALLRERGSGGVTLDAVLARSGAPRGSVYHHFPGGRDELLVSAARHSGDFIGELIAAAITRDDAAGPVDAFVSFWKQVLADSDFRAGCPIVALAVNHREDLPEASELVREVFTGWHGQIKAVLLAEGLTESEAQRFATLTIAATEGAIVLARAHKSSAPLDEVGESLGQLHRSFLQAGVATRA